MGHRVSGKGVSKFMGGGTRRGMGTINISLQIVDPKWRPGKEGDSPKMITRQYRVSLAGKKTTVYYTALGSLRKVGNNTREHLNVLQALNKHFEEKRAERVQEQPQDDVVKAQNEATVPDPIALDSDEPLEDEVLEEPVDTIPAIEEPQPF